MRSSTPTAAAAVVIALILSGCATRSQQIEQARQQVTATCESAAADGQIDRIRRWTPVPFTGTTMPVSATAHEYGPVPEDRPAIEALQRSIDTCTNARIGYLRAVGNEAGAAAEQAEHSAVTRALADLYAGRTTWGQFNTARLAARQALAAQSDRIAERQAERQADEAAAARQRMGVMMQQQQQAQQQQQVYQRQMQQYQQRSQPSAIHCTTQTIGQQTHTNCQ